MDSVDPDDSSPNGFDGTHRTDNLSAVNGPVGTAVNVPRVNNSDGITCGNVIPNPELTGGFTVEGWCRPTQYGGMSDGAAMFGKKQFVSIRIASDSQVTVTTPGKSDHKLTGLALPAVNTWWHWAVTFKMNTGTDGLKLYVNGQCVKTAGAGDINDKTGTTEVFLGNNEWNQAFKGDLDEIRLSADLKSADWIYATYAAQNDAAFLTAGEAQAYEASAAPDVGLVAPASAVFYTNATLTATIGSLGMDDGMTTDASWVDPLLVVSRNADLSDPVFSLPLSRVSSAPVSVSVAVLPLVTNTTYYAQLRATNSFDVAGESGAVSFTTLDPQPPAGSILFHSRGLTTLSARATVSDFGTGSASATARVEASTSSDFTTVAAVSDETMSVVGASANYTVPGLAPDTSYFLRLHIVNEWGLSTYVPLDGSYSTRDVPIAATGIGYVFSADNATVDLTFGVTEVFDGASCTATLTYDGRTLDAKNFTSAKTLSWTGVAAAPGTKTATVTVTADAGGATYTKTWSLPVTPGSAAVSVSSVSDHLSSATAVRLHVGDVATLPELAGAASYKAMNGRFCSLDGNVLVAIEPGIVGVQCVDTAFNTNTLAVIVLPEAVGSGSVYVYKETVSTGDRIWTTAAAWEKVGAETNDLWPKDADDIAVIPFYQYTGEKYLRLTEDVAIGGLYYGQFLDATNDKLTIERHKNSSTKTVSFERTDGEPAIVKICANTTENRQNELKFGGYEHSTAYLSDTILDAGWDGSDNSNCRGRFSSAENNTNTIPAGVTVSVVNFDRTGYGVGATMWPGHLKGAGLFWNRSSGTMRWDGGLANFTGTIRDSGGYMNASTDRCGPTYLRTGACTNVAVEVIGQVGRSGGSPYTSWAGNAVGCLKVGLNHSYGAEPQHPETNWFPRTLTLHGGTMYRDPAGVKWGAGAAGGVRDLRCTKRLTVEGGLNNIGGTGGDNAIPWFEADELVHGDKATIRIVDHSRANTASTATTTNHVTILHGVSAYLVGAAGNPEESDVYPIVPWMVAPITAWDDSWDRYPFFACFDDNDRLIRPVYYDTALGAAASEKSNAYVSDKTIQIDHDVTLNSLFLLNQNKNKWLGEGRTLTLTSGGLVLRNSSSSIGLPGRTDNGSLVLGDSTHPGYVFAKSSNDSQPNQIWADVTAPGGFVAAYTGYLTLGGDQTGIDDEIAVNAGSLQLGTADNSCQLAKDLPIRIYANATLKLPNDSSTTGNILKFDGAAGWFGKVEVPEGVAAKCKKAYWRDYPETAEWQVLKRGIYGSSESGAPNVRDDLFSGAGTLQILRDDSTMPFFIIVR